MAFSPAKPGTRNQAPQPITYSRSVTFTLTHDCPWHCAYCGFRTDDEGLLSEAYLNQLLDDARDQGAEEALLISGEAPDSLSHIRHQLSERGYTDFLDFAIHVADRCLDAGLLPHANLGALSESQLARLRPHCVSMGVMLENIADDRSIAPEKLSRGRVRTLEAAGRLKIPFTTGILIGLGESIDSRMQSLDALAELHIRHGHLQEILIQNYQPNPGSSLGETPQQLTGKEIIDLIHYWKTIAPDVPVQIPPNLNPFLEELWPFLDDLGGISLNRDEVNPDNPWAPIDEYATRALKAGRQLIPRLAIYDRFLEDGGKWLDDDLRASVQDRLVELQKHGL